MFLLSSCFCILRAGCLYAIRTVPCHRRAKALEGEYVGDNEVRDSEERKYLTQGGDEISVCHTDRFHGTDDTHRFPEIGRTCYAVFVLMNTYRISGRWLYRGQDLPVLARRTDHMYVRIVQIVFTGQMIRIIFTGFRPLYVC